MVNKLRGIISISVILFLIFSANALAEAGALALGISPTLVPAPTLISPEEKIIGSNFKIMVSGLTRDNTLVKIYIDDAYDGQTDFLFDRSGTANFAYEPNLRLSLGAHKIRAMAVDNFGNNSLMSESKDFIVELPFPAPTMYQPVVNNQTFSNRPFIVGLAKNDSKIRVYIDKKYNGEFLVKNHSSGTANFAYKPKIALARGEHSIYTVAVDQRNKQSIRSNTIAFFALGAAIAESAKEENGEAAANVEERKESIEATQEPVVISESTGAVLEEPAGEFNGQSVGSTTLFSGQTPDSNGNGQERENVKSGIDSNVDEGQRGIGRELPDKEQAAIEKIKGLIGGGIEEANSNSGMLNEGKQNQGRLKFSMILFILFLVGIVAWLLWVNRELIKERRAQNETLSSSVDPVDAKVVANQGASGEKKDGEDKNDPPNFGQENKLF